MKLIKAVINHEDLTALADELSRHKFWFSTVATVSGVIQEGKLTVFIKAEEETVSDIIAIIKEICPTRTKYVNTLPPLMEPGELFAPSPTEVEVTGATVFVLNVEQFYQF